MVPLASLWLPILLSAVFVFVASSIIHMFLGYHAKDFRALPSETEVMEALRKFNIPPGDYMVPCPTGRDAMRSPEFKDKRDKGPVAVMTVMKSGPFSMGPSMLLWFVYCLVVSVFAGYLASRAVGPGTPYLTVFRFAGTTAFAGYALAQVQQSIWYQRSWGTTSRNLFDGLVYGLLTAGTFGWLWPR